jgi:hypothetical protein
MTRSDSLRLLRAAMLVCLPLMAQQTGITGRVADPSGATIANAKVTASGEDGSGPTPTCSSIR